MNYRALAITVSTFLLSSQIYVSAADGEGGRRPEGDRPRPDAEREQRRPDGPSPAVKFILEHAAELNLTAEQKAVFEAMTKGPLSVLSEEQQKKLRELRPREGDGPPRRDGEVDRPRRPDGEGDRPRRVEGDGERVRKEGDAPRRVDGEGERRRDPAPDRPRRPAEGDRK